jgi:hypothetical protein
MILLLLERGRQFPVKNCGKQHPHAIAQRGAGCGRGCRLWKNVIIEFGKRIFTEVAKQGARQVAFEVERLLLDGERLPVKYADAMSVNRKV